MDEMCNAKRGVRGGLGITLIRSFSIQGGGSCLPWIGWCYRLDDSHRPLATSNITHQTRKVNAVHIPPLHTHTHTYPDSPLHHRFMPCKMKPTDSTSLQIWQTRQNVDPSATNFWSSPHAVHSEQALRTPDRCP
eukprot:477967-Pyramimonas_sp.AAC.2